MSYRVYFGIKGKFEIPSDFFNMDTKEVENDVVQIAFLRQNEENLTKNEQKELHDLEHRQYIYTNSYGFPIYLIHDFHVLESLNYSMINRFNYDTIIYNIHTKTAYIIMPSEDTVCLKLIYNGEAYIPVKIPFRIIDSNMTIQFLIQLIESCKMNVTLLDHGDEEHGYVEDECRRELVHQTFKNGILSD